MVDGADNVIVVGAALIRDDRVLAARRSRPAELAGRWEFPGGKREAGETDADALIRECREELNIDIVVGAALGTTAVRAGVQLRVYLATLRAGEPTPNPLDSHDELRWVAADELEGLDWLPADRPVLPVLRRHLPPNNDANVVPGHH
jgi:8-oxo-dGTP diphosphatase